MVAGLFVVPGELVDTGLLVVPDELVDAGLFVVPGEPVVHDLGVVNGAVLPDPEVVAELPVHGGSLGVTLRTLP